MRNLTLVLKSKLCKIYPESLLDKHQPLADASLLPCDRSIVPKPGSLCHYGLVTGWWKELSYGYMV